MKPRYLSFLIPALVLGAGIGWYIYRSKLTAGEHTGSLYETATYGEQPLVFYDEKLFYQGIVESKKYAGEVPNFKIQGGIIPHHLLAGELIADFFGILQKQKPDTVILIGPNHYDRGRYPVLTSQSQWKTPFGNVMPKTNAIGEILKYNAAEVDEKTFNNEHSIGGIMPYIKYYLPEATIVPFILKSGMTEDEVKILAEHIVGLVDDTTVIIASVDFSHYLTRAEADKKDEITRKSMENFEYRKILTLSVDYLDSGPSIATLLLSMQKIGATNFVLRNHANSDTITDTVYAETTSYFSAFFH